MNTAGKHAYKQLYEDARAILNRHDPMGLIAIGAPDDEYEPEVGTILPRMSSARGAAGVEAIMAEEFLRWFSETFPPGSLRDAAADVWAAYGRFRDSVEAT
jgi:hypothetical protein